ncbi:hypothetical protein IC619_015395 [Hazenella sp. IB182353]|uniref:hypothetical protein n=1 Tax=Polycladospora coralii TaxID=2771432 RepID=UPI001BCF53BA|nr:hypothetical protein [Polycladospora coralii]MBS7531857.1 hypothetical protein [Polycladospora coralii]
MKKLLLVSSIAFAMLLSNGTSGVVDATTSSESTLLAGCISGLQHTCMLDAV